MFSMNEKIFAAVIYLDFRSGNRIFPQHNLSVKADTFPGSITPFILLPAVHPFFLYKQVQKKKKKIPKLLIKSKLITKSPCQVIFSKASLFGRDTYSEVGWTQLTTITF